MEYHTITSESTFRDSISKGELVFNVLYTISNQVYNRLIEGGARKSLHNPHQLSQTTSMIQRSLETQFQIKSSCYRNILAILIGIRISRDQDIPEENKAVLLETSLFDPQEVTHWYEIYPHEFPSYRGTIVHTILVNVLQVTLHELEKSEEHSVRGYSRKILGTIQTAKDDLNLQRQKSFRHSDFTYKLIGFLSQ